MNMSIPVKLVRGASSVTTSSVERVRLPRLSTYLNSALFRTSYVG